LRKRISRGMNSNSCCNSEEDKLAVDVFRRPDRIMIAPPPDFDI
jgi:hypothetical protein